MGIQNVIINTSTTIARKSKYLAQNFRSVAPEFKGIVTDVVQINKTSNNIGFNEFCNIMKRNGICDFTRLDFENFIRFNKNNTNINELIYSPDKLKSFILK